MKNFDLNSMGVHEMNTLEMQETDGGIIWLLVAAAVVLLGTSSCQTKITIQIGGTNNQVIDGTQSVSDSLNNGGEFTYPVEKK